MSRVAGATFLLYGEPIAKRQCQDVLDGRPPINAHILANPSLFLKVCVSNGSGEHWGCLGLNSPESQALQAREPGESLIKVKAEAFPRK